VEYLHHRYQVAETRRALAQERAEHRGTLAIQTRAWRLMVAELQNNLVVFSIRARRRRSFPGSSPGR
jgi:hypothetical protein